MRKTRFLLATMAVLLCSVMASAQEFYVDYTQYTVTDPINKTVEVTTFGNTVKLVRYGMAEIPKSVAYDGQWYSVTSIGSKAFANCCGKLTSVTIPSSITSIKGGAFGKCNKLEIVSISSIEAWCGIDFENRSANPLDYADKLYLNDELVTELIIPDGVSTIGDYVFYRCSSLTSITIPESVTSIGESAFQNCSSLTSITIPESVTSIGEYAFQNCGRLASVTIPESAIKIGRSAFDSTAWYNNHPDGIVYLGNILYKYKGTMPDNTTIEVKEGTTMIGAVAFVSCEGLVSITMPESVVEIGVSAFCGCENLVSIDLPDSVLLLEEKAFYNCPSLASITIPESVTSIGKEAFFDCSGLASITIGDGVTSIGKEAFYDCSSLASITIGKSVNSIGEKAFYKCHNLDSVHISDIAAWLSIDFEGYESNPIYYAYDLYLNGELVTEIAIPEGITEIKDYAFYRCYRLASVTVPKSVTKIGTYAFAGTGWVGQFPDGEVYINTVLYTYKGVMPERMTIKVKEGTTCIHSYAFSGRDSLVAITIPKSVTSIGYNPFSGCNNLTSIIVEDGNAVYDSRDKCNAVIEASTNTLISGCRTTTIPKTVKKIGYSAFSGNCSPSSVVIPGSVIEIGDNAFRGCYDIKELVFEDGNERLLLGCNHVYGDSSEDLFSSSPIEKAYLGRNLNSSPFADKKDLTSVVIGDSVTEIGSSAFSGCTRLASVRIGDNVTSIGRSAFAECDSLTSIVIPKNVSMIKDDAFSGCEKLSVVINYSDLYMQKGSTTHGYVAYYAQKVLQGVDASVGDYYFYTDANGVNYLRYYVGSDTILTLPESYNGEDYEVETGVFADYDSLTSIVVSEGVRAIHDNAFKDCKNLQSIIMGSNVDRFGEDAFAGCTNVKELTVMGSVMPYIPSEVFTSITLCSPVPLEAKEFANTVYRNCELHVPEGAIARYQAADVWKNFWYIYEFDPNAISLVVLNQDSVTLNEGETITLVATVLPESATDKTVTWSSSDEQVAIVIDGVVTAVGEGVSVITAKAGDKEATCVVTVKLSDSVEHLEFLNQNTQSIYDLSGRKILVDDLRELQKGVYIINGRKVVVK